MAPENFIALILTHGRADNVVTYKVLRKYGYTGPICLVVDDEDSQYEKYCENFPNEVVQFHKAGVDCNTFDNLKDRKVILFARNAAFDVARKLGYRYFIELDDDYKHFYMKFDKNREFKATHFTSLDDVFSVMLDYFKNTPQITSLAMAQGGDYIGGSECHRAKTITAWRKAMNSFICDTERPFKFCGRINEDVNTYTMLGSRGVVFLTTNQVCLLQSLSQTNAGGMTETYLNGGTYKKSFYSIICMPSAVKIRMMGRKAMRVHHNINWRNCVPCILREDVKKKCM